VIKLGPGNDDAAREALAAWPNGLHVGGGITVDNAEEWIAAGVGGNVWMCPSFCLPLSLLLWGSLPVSRHASTGVWG
jgi:hypothetical protein